jgi:hypothetical protein
MSDIEEENEDYTIYPLKADPLKVKYNPVGKSLLKPPFTMGIIASRHTGKTVLAQNLFCRPFPFYGGCFDRIILISGTLKADRSARHMVDYIGDDNCFEEYDDRIITGLIDQQKNVAPEDQEKILIIADDIPSLGASQTCALYRLATTARHHNISVVYISQLLRSQGKGGGLGLSARNNIEGYFIGRQSNRKVLDSIAEELSHFQSPDAMLKCYNDIVAGNPYSFMFCNSRNLSIMDNLKEEVFRRYDENGNYNPDYSGRSALKNELLE